LIGLGGEDPDACRQDIGFAVERPEQVIPAASPHERLLRRRVNVRCAPSGCNSTESDNNLSRPVRSGAMRLWCPEHCDSPPISATRGDSPVSNVATDDPLGYSGRSWKCVLSIDHFCAKWHSMVHTGRVQASIQAGGVVGLPYQQILSPQGWIDDRFQEPNG